MSDIILDRTNFHIASIFGLLSIGFQIDPDHGMERRIVVGDWHPSLEGALQSLNSLPLPTSSLDPVIDAYCAILGSTVSGPWTIRSRTADDRLIEQGMQCDRMAIEARLDRIGR